MTDSSFTQPQQLSALQGQLADAAAAQGDLEVAYLLYAKGSAAVSQQRPGDGESLAAGRLQTLVAMCQVPLATGPAAATPALASGAAAFSSSQHTQHSTPSAQTLSGDHMTSSSSSGSSPTQQPLPKRWQQMQQRLLLSAADNTTSGPINTASTNSSTSTTSSTPSTNSSSSKARRVFCASDLHVDRAGGANLAWLQSISSSSFRQDVIIVAGDVADTAAAVSAAFRLLAERFWRVVWVPGNHCLWLRGDTRDGETYPDSWAKLMALRQVADAAGVDVGPVEVAPGLLVVPLLSWYNAAFDVVDPRPGRYQHDSFCRWGPVAEPDVWQVMLKLNSSTLQLVQQYRQHWRQQQQQQQQQQGSGVSWATSGFLAVSSSSGRRVPGLQLNLTKHRRQQQQPPPAAAASKPTAAALAAAEDPAGVGSSSGSSMLSGLPHSSSGASVASLAGASSSSLDSSSSGSSCQHGSSAGVSASPSSTSSTGACSPMDPASNPAPPTAAAAAAATDVTVITVSHFLPHPELPHSRFSDLAKAMGCLELQLQMQQVSSAVHVYGHSHRCADVTLEYTLPAVGSVQQQQQQACRYVQYAVDAVGAEAAGLYCLWDGQQLCAPGTVVNRCG